MTRRWRAGRRKAPSSRHRGGDHIAVGEAGLHQALIDAAQMSVVPSWCAPTISPGRTAHSRGICSAPRSLARRAMRAAEGVLPASLNAYRQGKPTFGACHECIVNAQVDAIRFKPFRSCPALHSQVALIALWCLVISARCWTGGNLGRDNFRARRVSFQIATVLPKGSISRWARRWRLNHLRGRGALPIRDCCVRPGCISGAHQRRHHRHLRASIKAWWSPASRRRCVAAAVAGRGRLPAAARHLARHLPACSPKRPIGGIAPSPIFQSVYDLRGKRV